MNPALVRSGSAGVTACLIHASSVTPRKGKGHRITSTGGVCVASVTDSGQLQAVSSPRRVAVIASLTYSLTNFRLYLLKRMAEAGHEVTAFAPDQDSKVVETLQDIGIRFVQIPMARTGLNPLSDLHTLFALWREFRRLKPDTILPYTMKPIIYGCLAGLLSGVPNRFALVTGLGHVFSDHEAGLRVKIVRSLSVWLYRLALIGVKRVFVYNDADANDFRKYRLIGNLSLIEHIPGSGVKLDDYGESEAPLEPVTFLLIARLLREKGVLEYVEAARLLHSKYPGARVQLLGPVDPSPSGLSRARVDQLAEEGIVEYLGVTTDVRPYLAKCTVFVLPSYYREGIPRTILEAMATGRAIITTDAPGCRDTVVNGENGLLVPPRDARALAAAMEALCADPELAARMGKRSRELAGERFDVEIVNQKLLSAMGLI